MGTVYRESERWVILDNGPNSQKLYLGTEDRYGMVQLSIYGPRGGEHGVIRVSASDLRKMLLLAGIAKRAK